MRAVYFKDGEVELREVREPSDEGVRVIVRSIGICGSDLHMLEMKSPLNCVVGHEVAGVLDNGTSVAVEPTMPCHECPSCRAGDYNLCQARAGKSLGVGRDGGMADELRVPERCLVYLPSNVDVRDACLVEPLAVAVHGLRRAGLEASERVAVIGGGAIGLCAVAVAKAGDATVGLSARYDHQMAAGMSLGAREVEGQYDLVVDCAGTDKAVNRAVRLCRPKGRILILGTHWNGLPFPQIPAMMKEVTVISSFMYAANGAVRDFDVAAMLLSRHPEIARASITHRFPLAEVKQAFAVARDRKAGAIKVVLEP
ncbi:MAG: alcohol dehydrogenase catalytic domain-containing protein [Chloroflexi bacterium]|nr:alcohol dehydrogenase catalytic domain-containing protein [Chloroflexota bacterium]